MGRAEEVPAVDFLEAAVVVAAVVAVGLDNLVLVLTKDVHFVNILTWL